MQCAWSCTRPISNLDLRVYVNASVDADAGSLLNAVLREIIASVVNVTEYSVDDCQCLQRILSTVVAQVTADDRNALFPPPVRSSEGGFEFTGLESPKPPRKSVVVADGDQLQQPIDEHCPVKVILERCVPAWPKYVELVEFFGLGLAGVAERWADGNGPLAMHVTAPEVARLIEAVFERTARRDAFVQQLRRNPSVHAAAARN
jgi:hypothetical protein